MIQALYYDIVYNKVIIRACIMDLEMPYFLVWSLSSSAWGIMRYTVQCTALQPEEAKEEEHGNSVKIEITNITPVLRAFLDFFSRYH